MNKNLSYLSLIDSHTKFQNSRQNGTKGLFMSISPVKVIFNHKPKLESSDLFNMQYRTKQVTSRHNSSSLERQKYLNERLTIPLKKDDPDLQNQIKE